MFSKNPADAELAERNVRRSPELNGGISASQAAMATIEGGTGRQKEALSRFERVLKDDPANVEALTGAARIYPRAGRFAEAERTYNLAVLTRPDYWGMYKPA